MPKCSECKYGELYEAKKDLPTMYYCEICYEWIEEKTAELDELRCDAYVPNDNVNTTERS